MAGKKRAAQRCLHTSAKKAATNRAATAAAKEYLQGDKQKNKNKIGSSSATDDNQQYHILKLIPIKQEECIALLKEKNVDCGGTQIDSDDKIKRSPFTLKLPLNCKDIADDFVDDYQSGDESTNTSKRSKKPDYIRYWSPDDENENYSVVMKMGRNQMNPPDGKISRKLSYVGLSNDGEAWISMCQKPSDHLVHIDGKIIEEPKGGKLSLHNGTVLSLFGQTGFAYLVEIQSSVLANKKHVLTRIDDVCTTYNMCCVCRDPYEVDSDSTSEARLPIKGTCGHDMCEECLDSNFASLLSGKQKLRYIKCPLCNEKKAFDIQNKVKDRILCDLLKAIAPKATDGGNSQVVEQPRTDTDGMIGKDTEKSELIKRNEELTKLALENARLRKRVEELEKLAPENAQLKKRIEELESNPKEADQKMAESDDSDFQDDEVVEVEVPPGSASAQEHDSESSSTRLETSLRHNATPPTPDTSEEQVDSSAPANKWACTSCTFLNMMRRKKCEICSERRK